MKPRLLPGVRRSVTVPGVHKKYKQSMVKNKLNANTPRYWNVPVEEDKSGKPYVAPEAEVKESPTLEGKKWWEEYATYRPWESCGPDKERISDEGVAAAKADFQTNRILTFDTIAREIMDLHERKNNDYGDAAYESYKEFGINSYVMRIGDKYRRLKTLTSPGVEQKVKDESIEDTLRDLAAYSIMAVEALHRK